MVFTGCWVCNRLGEVGYPASSSRKRSSLGTGTDDSLANTPETNATVPLHQMGAGHDSEKTSGRWRRTSGGGLRVLRSSVDGAEGDAGLDRTRVLSVVSITQYIQEVQVCSCCYLCHQYFLSILKFYSSFLS